LIHLNNAANWSKKQDHLSTDRISKALQIEKSGRLLGLILLFEAANTAHADN
jgi:hypothetical protein